MGSCESSCERYVDDIADIQTYNRCDILEPFPLNIQIVRNEGRFDTTYQVFIKNGGNFITFKVIDAGFRPIEISDIPPGVTINADPSLITAYVTLNAPQNFPLNTYIPGDQYHINILDRRCATSSASAQIIRPENYQVNTILESSSITSKNISVSNNIPQINIQAQTTLNGSDLSDAVFTILDEFEYYDPKLKYDNTCKLRQDINPKTSIFRECNVQMVSVVAGKGITLWEKLQYLYINDPSNDANVYAFYKSIALYGMAKYILSRLLFNKFNINFLLGKYNKKFLDKLSTSRFCAFTAYFEQNDYNKYFLYTN